MLFSANLENQDTETLPDYGKVQWVEYEPKSWSDLLPGASKSARDIVGELLRYQSSRRSSAKMVSPCVLLEVFIQRTDCKPRSSSTHTLKGVHFDRYVASNTNQQFQWN
jgi:hypothetical protein